MPHCLKNSMCSGSSTMCTCTCKSCAPEKKAKRKRLQISEEAQANAVDRLRGALQRRLQQKGRGTFASTHEVLGIITEEFKELIDAVQSNDRNQVMKELEDIAVSCVFAFACDDENGLEW